MADVAASYGYQITPVPEGNRVTYQRLPLPKKVYVLSAILAVPMLIVTGVSFMWPACGIFVFLFFCVIVPVRLWILYRRRVAPPTTFLITPSHLVIGDARYDRSHISRFSIHDPMSSSSEVVYHQGQGGGFYIGGAGAAGVGMAAGMNALNSASQGMRQLGQQVGEAAADSVKAVSVSIRFAYGEKTHTLATGLSASRARLLLDAVVKLFSEASDAKGIP